MKERPILFSAPMVRALLDGSKTQTRRVVKPQPVGGCFYVMNGAGDHALHMSDVLGREFVPPTARSRDHRLPCPYGVPGDRLWVKEAFAYSVRDPDAANETYSPETHEIVTRADFEGTGDWEHYDGEGNRSKCAPTWVSSRFMPRWASRLTLEVTEVRVQRVQDISEEDARAEGTLCDACARPIAQHEFPRGPECFWSHATPGWQTYSFKKLWDSINGKREGCSWAANPWVWALTFKRVAP